LRSQSKVCNVLRLIPGKEERYLNGHLNKNRQIVCSHPATAFANVEWRDSGLVLREVLMWRRSG
jgi:hypothetical protein